MSKINTQEKETEPTKKTRKRPSRSQIIVTDAASAREKISRIIKSVEKGEMDPQIGRIVTYLIQTFLSADKVVKMETELSDTITYENEKVRNDAAIRFQKLSEILSQLVGEEKYKEIVTALDEAEAAMGVEINNSNENLRKAIKERTSFNLATKTSESPEWIVENVKSALRGIRHLDSEIAKIVQFMKDLRMIK